MDKVLLYVDRVEDGYAFCEDEDLNRYYLNLKDIKFDLKEGDVILRRENGEVFLDEKQKIIRQNKIKELQMRVFKNNQRGENYEL